MMQRSDAPTALHQGHFIDEERFVLSLLISHPTGDVYAVVCHLDS